jgi:hypothetical protein
MLQLGLQGSALYCDNYKVVIICRKGPGLYVLRRWNINEQSFFNNRLQTGSKNKGGKNQQ